jgi:putative flippase GtrA
MIFFKRFLGIGIINTIFAYIVFIILLQVLNYNISYTISFMATIILSYFLNSKYVFKQKVSLSKFIKFPIVYVVQYLFGIVILNLLNIYMNTSNYINMLIVTLVSVPITFMLSKRIIGVGNAK